MGTITPILDTLLPQVLGRTGDVARVGARAAYGPLSALRPVSGEMSSLAREGTPARSRFDASGRALTGVAAAGTRARGATADPPTARAIARAIAGGTASDRVSAELHLSRGGDTLARLLAGVAGSPEPSAVSAGRALAAGVAALQPSRLADLLGRQVTNSGLFYESHLAAWVRGQFPRARLADEPQARLGSATAGPDDASSPQNPAPASVDPRLAPVMRQQIELLASGVFQWQGEAWPGVPMRWSIEREEAGAASDDERFMPATTALSLELPGIGVFEARLRLVGDCVSVAAWAEPGAGRDLLAADLNTLRRRLGGAGFDQPSVRLVTESVT